MRRLNVVLLATIQLCLALLPGFDVHSDLLAYPQFEVVFSEGSISDKEAHELLESQARDATDSADGSQSSAGDARETTAADAGNAADEISYSYELMNMPPHRYLCAIPNIPPPGPENQTANELAKAEEARELSRAASSGWELLSQLEDRCLYFMSGWWSYRFCDNHEVAQYHAVTAMTHGQPPRRDPQTPEYVLGRVPALPAGSEVEARDRAGSKSVPAELQVKGDQRYLVQKLEGGTICDLTGRERTIEVQYHCVPGMTTDRIGWIKEVTICAYVMVVNSPRLCQNAVFLPPKETKANAIKCQLISAAAADDDDRSTPRLEQTEGAQPDGVGGAEGEKTTAGSRAGDEAGDEAGHDAAEELGVVTVGGVVVGARHVLSGADEVGKPPLKLAAPQNTFETSVGDRMVDVLIKVASKADGGKVEKMSTDELKRLELDPSVVEDMKKKMERLAGDQGWKLEVVEIDGGNMRELRGFVDEKPKAAGGEGQQQASSDEDDGHDEEGGGGDRHHLPADGQDEQQASVGQDQHQVPHGHGGQQAADEKDEGAKDDVRDEGSKETFFRDEL
ncbi:Protein OS-9 like protein [Drechmeria coniospora]|uniref:Endoplasmic reticulum lectin n=1 Tax=Drechmeria coniospora TaxID=98403 RepID=A0A151GN35_DRECN|nr:Protein OS-9 like protein [Drechmeria coniospora]KYK58488.1 Protein OS-9 like protein [Drechmeria coniospora]ODA83865.1 hypothetical protein RJ55_02381 [Drechmeria coniospora]